MTQENTCDTLIANHSNGKAINQPSTSTPPPSSTPLHIEKPIYDVVLHPPKGTIQKNTFNTSAHAIQNYNIIEYFAQSPCVMSSLKVIQNIPSQRRTLLSTIRDMDPE